MGFDKLPNKGDAELGTAIKGMDHMVANFGIDGGRMLSLLPGFENTRHIFVDEQDVFRTAKEVRERWMTPEEQEKKGYAILLSRSPSAEERKIDPVNSLLSMKSAAMMEQYAGPKTLAERAINELKKYDFEPAIFEARKKSIENWIEYLTEGMEKQNLKLIVSNLCEATSPIDNKPILKLEKRDDLRNLEFKPIEVVGAPGRGIVAYVAKNEGSEVTNGEELKKVIRSLRSVEDVLQIDSTTKDRSVIYVVLPSDFLNVGGLEQSGIVVLVANKAGEIINEDHENVHLVLQRKFGGHPGIPSLSEGVANAVDNLLNNRLTVGASEWFVKLGKAGEKLRAGKDQLQSNTRLLSERGGESAYAKAYEMNVLFEVTMLMFPKSWPNIVKEMYRAGNEIKIDEDFKNLLQREMIYNLLKKAVYTVGDTEEGRKENRKLGELMDSIGVPKGQDRIPKFIEAVTGEYLSK